MIAGLQSLDAYTDAGASCDLYITPCASSRSATKKGDRAAAPPRLAPTGAPLQLCWNFQADGLTCDRFSEPIEDD